MGVRPPANDGNDEPDTIEFGIAALDARLEDRDVSFPVTVEELDAKYGEMRIAVDASGHEMRLGTALDRCGRDSFDSKQDLLNALHPVFEGKREAISGSLLGRLRALVPF